MSEAGRSFCRRSGALAAALVAAGVTAPAHATVTVFECTNPSSGAHWTLRVDSDQGTVDSFPARIADGRIAWHDTAHGGYYELDTGSGALTVRFASSTGGYFLHDRCHATP